MCMCIRMFIVNNKLKSRWIFSCNFFAKFIEIYFIILQIQIDRDGDADASDAMMMNVLLNQF